MFLLLLAYLGGVLTIVSPCILPVLPFVFARADRPFQRNGLPMLIGMGVTFAAVASLAAVGGAWAVHANEIGRDAALVVLALLGVSLLSTRVADWMARPFVALGNRLSRRRDADEDSIWAALGLGVATGLLWAPCAGPILGLLLTAAALNGANFGTTVLLLLYALGAVTSLALAIGIGGQAFALMKRALGAGDVVRRVLGVLVLAGVVAIAFGLDTGVLTRWSLSGSNGIEQRLVDATKGGTPAPQPDHRKGDPLPVAGDMPSLDGATGWLNSAPLTNESLRGKVVVVDFWTYSCINCLRALPYVRAWQQKYAGHGLVVIGVHAPEFAFEKNIANVRAAVSRLGVTYPVALDNDFNLWKGFRNQYWPGHFFIDKHGRIRHHRFGEGGYADSEGVIQQLLEEAGNTDVPQGVVNPDAGGAEAADSGITTRSPETYLGYARSSGYVGTRFVFDDAWAYVPMPSLAKNQWTLSGQWTVKPQLLLADAAAARIRYRFSGRDVHLVLGSPPGRRVRFRVTVDGQAPGAEHGEDVDAAGLGVVDGQRLYQLVRQRDGRARTFEIEFLDPGVQAYVFTFG